jgi:NAD+ kinase
MSRPRTITVFTHEFPGQTGDVLRRLIDAAVAAGVEVHLPEEEVTKHQLQEREGTVFGADPAGDTDLAVVLGGDGTILRALRVFAGRKVPVFAFNFGAIGFLSTVDHGRTDDGIERVVSGDFELLPIPALQVETPKGPRMGANDISFHRHPERRVAELGYAVAGEQLGKVRCDGLVASTPVGSTGYNLANGGPILAWGVEGFVVSFIAPHTLTARALVVAPGDTLTVLNQSQREPVDVTTDGRNVCSLEPGDKIDVHFVPDQVLLAQVPGTSFYHRLSETFGKLA